MRRIIRVEDEWSVDSEKAGGFGGHITGSRALNAGGASRIRCWGLSAGISSGRWNGLINRPAPAWIPSRDLAKPS